MKKNTTPVWGIVLVVLGIFVALKALGFFDVNFFFWVSLVILIPCFIGFCSNRTGRSGYLIGMLVGVLFMLLSLDVIRWGMFVPLCLAAVFLSIGLKMLIKGDRNPDNGNMGGGTDSASYGGPDSQGAGFGNQTYSQGYSDTTQYVKYDENGEVKTVYTNAEDAQRANDGAGQQSGGASAYTGPNPGSSGAGFYSSGMGTGGNGIPNGYQAYSAVLASRVVNFDNERFPGAMLSAVMGAVTLNLRNAIITEDVRVDAKSTLGGIDIFVPKNVKIVVNCTPILGGIDNKTVTPAGMINCPTIFINATCVLGGIEVNY